jgi:hypothetical protein
MSCSVVIRHFMPQCRRAHSPAQRHDTPREVTKPSLKGIEDPGEVLRESATDEAPRTE